MPLGTQQPQFDAIPNMYVVPVPREDSGLVETMGSPGPSQSTSMLSINPLSSMVAEIGAVEGNFPGVDHNTSFSKTNLVEQSDNTKLRWDLRFCSLELEQAYTQEVNKKLCAMSIFPFTAVALYAVYSACMGSMFEEEKIILLTRWARPPVVAYNLCWIIGSALALALVALCVLRACYARSWPYEEWTLSIGVGVLILLRVFLGNRWRVARLFGEDPEEVFGVYSQDTELLLNQVMAVAYFGMFTPMRFRPFLMCCCVASTLSFGISTAIVDSPGDNWVRDFALCIVVIALLAVGQRRLEMMHRRSFLQHRSDDARIQQLEQQAQQREAMLHRWHDEQDYLRNHLDALQTFSALEHTHSQSQQRRGREPIPASKLQKKFASGGILELSVSTSSSLGASGFPPSVGNNFADTVDDGAGSQQSIPRKEEVPVPNKHLGRLLATFPRTRWDLVKQCVRMLRNPYYTLKDYHEHVTAAFPELELYRYADSPDGPDDTSAKKTKSRTTSPHSGEMEYQRTLGAFYSIYWLMRIDMNGRLGFCFGHKGNPEMELKQVHEKVPPPPKSEVAFFKMTDEQKRSNFYHNFPWHHFTEVFQKSGILTSDMQVCEERCAAMLALTAIHDIFKNESLLPTVQVGHMFKGYNVGEEIQDHDQALNYLLVYYPEALPSFAGLNAKQRKSVAFTQGKMDFNNGWLVQAEAPPQALFSTFKKLIVSGGATDEGVSFYFVHWLTDLAGAQPPALNGSGQFVLKSPDYVLAAFLQSFSYVWSLATKTETEVMEEYLIACWEQTKLEKPIPSGEDAVAIMRLSLQAQRFSRIAVRAYHALNDRDKLVLTLEMNKTGIVDQAYTTDRSAHQMAADGVAGKSGWIGQQVPALLIYYGPAMLQNNIGLDEGECLKTLAEVYRAGRAMWPLREPPIASVAERESASVPELVGDCSADAGEREARSISKSSRDASRCPSFASCSGAGSGDFAAGKAEHQPSVVTIRIEQLKDYVQKKDQMTRFEGWFMLQKNRQEAVVERHPFDAVMDWNANGQVYRWLRM